MELKGVEVGSFQAREDLSHLSEDEIAHRLIDSAITLAHVRGISIEQVLAGMMMSHRVAEMLGGVDGFDD